MKEHAGGRELAIADLVTKPGRYTLAVAYRSAHRCEEFGPSVQQMPALWHDAPILISNAVTLDVVRARPAHRKLDRE